MDKFTYDRISSSTATLQRRFDFICKVLKIEASGESSNQYATEKEEIKEETINPIGPAIESEDNTMGAMFEAIIKATSPESDNTSK
jgi:hypothetical protein